MIEETVQIHDKYQFEIKLGYKLEGKQRTTSYDIETYLFLPNSLGINRHFYTKDDFYNDIQAYIRLKTPTVLLKDLIQGENSPFQKLSRCFERLTSQLTDIAISEYEYQIKMFCCIFKSAIRDHVAFISTKIHTGDIQDLLGKYLEHTQRITQHFRKLRSIINVPIINKRLFSIYLFGDEYLSLLIESYTYELLEILKQKDFGGKDKYMNQLLTLISNELSYRQTQHYPSMPTLDSTNEEFIFRSGVLKKYMGSVLFLNTRIKQEGKFLEQLIFALAAGLAMAIATAAAFFAQIEYASLSLPLFIVLIISYMFKDRIKELTRGYLGKRLRHFLFDHKMNIFYSPKEKIGWCQESFAFTSWDKLPQPIVKLRDRDHFTEIENGWIGEKIILYRKRIKLFRKKLVHIYHDYPVESINDIMRLNVSRFLYKMDNPKKPIYVHTSGDQYKKIYGKRMYHMNMIIKYTMKDRVLYKRFRIVLSRGGIKRIENVVFDEEQMK